LFENKHLPEAIKVLQRVEEIFESFSCRNHLNIIGAPCETCTAAF